MKNIFDYVNPMSGKKGNILDMSDMWGSILGVVFLFLVVTMGQTLANKISGYIPNVNTAGTNLVSTPSPVQTSNLKKIY